jgi:PAS domain S-box-containing protein
VKKFVQAQAGTGAALILLGVTVMLGWALRIATIAQLVPNQPGTVFNSALCFTLIGFALLLPLVKERWAPVGQTAVGCYLMAISLVVLAESVADTNFGVDLPTLHTWLNDHNLRPGRMALNTAVGFMVCAVTLIFMPRVRRKAHGVVVQIATFALFAVGLTGVVSHSLDLELLYPRFHSSTMPLLTAAGMIVAAAGLWLNWCRSDWYQSRRYFREDEKVIFLGAGMLVVFGLTAGIASFSVQQRTLEQISSDNLGALLKSRISLFQDVFRHSTVDAQATAARPDLLHVMDLLHANPDSPEALAQLREIGSSMLSPEVTGVTVYDTDNREVIEFGHFSETADIATQLSGPVPSRLFWNGALYLHSRLPITDQDRTVGFIAVEQLLSMLTERMSKTQGMGQTGRMDMCIAKPDHLWCFPKYAGASVYRIPRHNERGQPLAMSHAVDGQFGIFKGLDSRGHTVMSAYGPVNSSGLGMVVKQDTEELFKPIRRQLEMTIPLLLLFVTLGAWLLRLHVKPLATRLFRSESDARERELKIHTVVANVGEGIITVDAQGVIESFNDAASHIFGYSPAEAIGQNIALIIPSNMRSWHEEGMRRYLHGEDQHIVGKKNVELPGLHKTGRMFHMELTLTEMRIGDQRLFIGIVRDISERKQAEAALRAAHVELETRVQQRTAELLKTNEFLKLEVTERKRIEETLRYTQDVLTKAQAIAQLGSWEMDIKTRKVKWSDEFYRMCGIPPKSVPASLDLGLELIHYEDREAARQALGGVSTGVGRECKHEWRIMRPDGSVRHVLAQGEIIYNEKRDPLTVVGTFLDITEHKLAETALRESSEKLRKVAAHQDRIKEEERKRIAREIHDELGGVLTGIKSYLSFVVERAERSGTGADRHVVEATRLADSAIETARKVIADLRPSVLDQLGLWAALEWYAGQIAERTGLNCSIAVDAKAAAVTFDSERSTALFRIVQETLTNVVRHAKASRVTIHATRERDSIIIELKDDGIGIEPQSLLNRESWGIEGMYERARFFGGELNINGVVGQGTSMILRMPMEEADAP